MTHISQVDNPPMMNVIFSIFFYIAPLGVQDIFCRCFHFFWLMLAMSTAECLIKMDSCLQLCMM